MQTQVDLDREKLVPVPAGVIDYVESLTGRRPHPATVIRWVRKGKSGSRLRCLDIANRIFTTPALMSEFFAGVMDQRFGARETQEPTTVQSQPDPVIAEQRAEELGI